MKSEILDERDPEISYTGCDVMLSEGVIAIAACGTDNDGKVVTDVKVWSRMTKRLMLKKVLPSKTTNVSVKLAGLTLLIR